MYTVLWTYGIDTHISRFGLSRAFGLRGSPIMRSYGKECFKFTENFLRMIFPATDQMKGLIKILACEMDRLEIQDKLNLSHRGNFRVNYLKPALEQGYIEMTIPDKPTGSLQKYQLTSIEKKLKDKL